MILARWVLAALACSSVALGCSKDNPPQDGEAIRPEISALPPEMRGALTPKAATPPAAEGWNDAQIAWQPYEAGLARAKELGKPICVVLYTGWCPHCRNYSHVFEDPRVVEKAKSFVMIRANADDAQTIAAKYTTDGAYVPRTYFLAPDGTVDTSIHAPRPKFQFFYDEHDPGSLLGGMEAALRKLVK